MSIDVRRLIVLPVLLMLAASAVPTSADPPASIDTLMLHGGEYQSNQGFGPSDPLWDAARRAGHQILSKPNGLFVRTQKDVHPYWWLLGACRGDRGIVITVTEEPNSTLGFYHVRSLHEMHGC